MIIPKLTDDQWHDFRIFCWYTCIGCAILLLTKCHGDIAVLNP